MVANHISVTHFFVPDMPRFQIRRGESDTSEK